MTVFRGDPGEVGVAPVGGSPMAEATPSPCPCTEMNLVKWDPVLGPIGMREGGGWRRG